MRNIDRSLNTGLAFPLIPAEIAEKYQIGELSFRDFGTERSDLEFDFSQANIPELITGILNHCTINSKENPAIDFFRDLTVGKRLELLIYLAAGETRAAFSFPFECAFCGQELELELTLNEISEAQNEAGQTETVEIEANGEILMFRKPVGRDQENWQNLYFENSETLFRQMANTLRKGSGKSIKLAAETLKKLESALDENDPLINFYCRVQCLECENSNDFLIDLTDFALARLNRLQQLLLLTVHRLASHYKWSEKEIFDIPQWRRMQYLNLIVDKR